MLIAMGILGPPAGVAHTATASWNGKYSLVRYAPEKSGTSVAARQAEPTFSADYVVVTSCSAGKCVAAATDGPTPQNPTLPTPSHYTRDGVRWVEHSKVWAPAKSCAFYTPQTDGTLRGTSHTDTLSGPCGGSVEMPVAACPR